MKKIATLYKEAYSGLSPDMWWLSLVMLINRSGTMVVPFMTLYLTESMHYSIAQAGMIMAIFGVGAVCGGFLGGKLTDTLGFYNVQLGALVCGGIMFIVLGQAQGFVMIAVCTFMLALLNETFRPANATAIAVYSKAENRTRSYSLNRLSINLGWAAGGALGGFIASKNYHLLFWIDGLTNIGAALLLRSVLSPAKNNNTPSRSDKKAKTPQAKTPYNDKLFLVFTMLTILFGATFFQLFATQPVFFKQKLLLTPFFIGVVMAVNGLLIALFEMTVVFKLEQRNKNMLYISIGAFLVGLSFMVFNILPGAEWLALASTVIVTVGEMLSMPFMNSFWVSRTNDNNRGLYAGLYTASWSVAQIGGPYVGAQIAQHFGFYALWWSVGFACTINALGFWWLGIEAKKEMDAKQVTTV